jgi:hypothetical protein
MIPTLPSFHWRADSVVACIVALTLALAACSSPNPPSPSASARGSEVASIATPAPTATPPPTLTPTALVVATPAPTPDITLPPAANRAQTIHLILHPGGDTEVSVRSLTGCSGCQGDYRLGDDELFDATTGKQVGTLVYVEFVVTTGDSLYYSPGNTIDLTGRGQIVFSETLHDDGSGRPATGAILGGTGEFLGATGYVVSRSLRGSGDFVITLTK